MTIDKYKGGILFEIKTKQFLFKCLIYTKQIGVDKGMYGIL